jgi:hypothetical protein
MNKIFHTAKVILLGLLVAQVLSTYHVYISNIELHHTLTSISKSGYFAVPNRHVMQQLKTFGPAFFGGLFFTLSIGAALSIFTFAVTWVWDRLFTRSKVVLIPLFPLWMGCLILLNRHGFNPLVTSYFTVIPAVVIFAFLKFMPVQGLEKGWLIKIVHIIPVLLLAILWVFQISNHMFLDIRDNLLLSNRFGTKINNFYYKYTLYPAEVFKSLGQKTLKTCNLKLIKEKTISQLLERKLLNHDYLPVDENVAVDLKISKEGNILNFENNGKTILQTSLKDFSMKSGSVLKEFSLKCDRYKFFRQLTFFSILVGLPLLLYFIIYTLFYLSFNLYIDSNISSLISSVICLIIGIALLIPIHYAKKEKIVVTNLAGTMESERWQENVAALKFIRQKEIEIGYYQAYKKMLKSPHIQVRYWLARALGVSRQYKTYKDLFTLLDDPHPNVVCQAFYALGKRGNTKVIKKIINRIETSDHWYKQWYAYKALRALGWKQKRSN